MGPVVVLGIIGLVGIYLCTLYSSLYLIGNGQGLYGLLLVVALLVPGIGAMLTIWKKDKK